MTRLHDLMAFDIFGNPKPIAPLPELRIIGEGMTRQQAQMAQGVFTQYCRSASMSSVPNPVEAGRLPDGTRYKAFTVGRNRYMQVWPDAVVDEAAETFYVPVGVLFGGIVDGPSLDSGSPTYLCTVLSPPGPEILEWTRQTIQIRGGIPHQVPSITNLAPLTYGATRSGAIASHSAEYFRPVEEIIGGTAVDLGENRAGLLRMHLVRDDGTPVTMRRGHLFRQEETVFLGSFYDSENNHLYFYRSSRGSAVGLGSAGYFEKEGDAFVGKTLAVQVPESYEQLSRADKLEVPFPPGGPYLSAIGGGDFWPVAVYNRDRTRVSVYQGIARLKTSWMDFPPTAPEERWFELPMLEYNYPLGIALEPRLSIHWWWMTSPNTSVPERQRSRLSDFESGTLSVLVDTESDQVLENTWVGGAYTAEPMPYSRARWTSDSVLSGVLTKAVQVGTSGVGMICTASSPVPSLSRSLTPRPPPSQTSEATYTHTISGPFTFNGHSKVTSRRILDDGFKDNERRRIFVETMQEIDLDVAGSKSYTSVGTSILNNPVAPFDPQDIYNSWGSSASWSDSMSATTTLTVNRLRTADIEGYGELVLDDASFVETTVNTRTEVGSTVNSLDVSNEVTFSSTHSIQRTCREIVIFDPDLNLLCYLETEFSANYSYAGVELDGTGLFEKFSPRPTLSPGEWPQISLVVEHGQNKIKLTTNMPAYDDFFIASLHPAAGLPPGYDGGAVSMFMREAAVGGVSYPTTNFRVLVPASPEPGLGVLFGLVTFQPSVLWTTDPKTGAQPGAFRTNYSGRGEFKDVAISQIMRIYFQESPDLRGAILAVLPREGAPELDFGRKAYLITADAIQEMPEEMAAGLDFTQMTVF